MSCLNGRLPIYASIFGHRVSHSTVFLSRTLAGRATPSDTVAETITREHLGTIDCFIPPYRGFWSLLTSPVLAMKIAYNQQAVQRMHLRSFRKTIKPDELSTANLVR